MRLIHKTATILLAWCGAQPLAADGLPQPFTAHYVGSKRILLFDVSAEATVRLERFAQHIRYTSRSEIRWSFYRRQFYDCSIIAIEGGKLYPRQYRHTDSGSDKYRVDTTFDWAAASARTVRGDSPEPRVVPLQWPTWDTLSVQVAIIDAAPRQLPGSESGAAVIERGKLARYTLRYNGEVATDSRLPGLRVVQVVSEKGGASDGENDSGSALWLAPEQHWVPVKIELDDVVLQLLELPDIEAVDEGSEEAVPQC